jgi:hypothetical protein
MSRSVLGRPGRLAAKYNMWVTIFYASDTMLVRGFGRSFISGHYNNGKPPKRVIQ